MPNLDGGHYFYTGLFPVNLEPVARKDGSITVPSHLLRETLAELPNFSEMPKATRTSPFARCDSTHFVRLAVFDDPAYNGRDGIDAIMGAIKGVDLAVHQPVDHFSRAWLIFTADFDASDEGSRDRWAAGLWRLMEKELKAIFGHCRGFDKVDSAESFGRYIAQGQVETTMSFNDYWIDPLPMKSLSMGTIGLTLLIGLGAVVGLAWLARREFGWDVGWLYWVLVGLLGLAVGAYAAYKLVMRVGARPFPTAPNSDLKSVLKGLYLQQRFTHFAIAHQGATPQQLHDGFGRFIAEVRPDDVEGPTQAPGVLHS